MYYLIARVGGSQTLNTDRDREIGAFSFDDQSLISSTLTQKHQALLSLVLLVLLLIQSTLLHRVR